MARSKIRILLTITGVLILLLSILAAAGYVLLYQSLPQKEGTVNVSFVQAPVSVTFDSMGLPQIWAQNENDAIAVLGYLHAADRLFQLDMTRRLAQGRLSALLGKEALEYDIQQRLVGHDRLARKALPELSAENRRRLQAYSAGVNGYVEGTTALPLEYQLLRTDFEPWTVRDALTILSFQTWFSNFLMSRDAFFTKLADRFGVDSARTFALPYPSWAPPTAPDQGGVESALFDAYFRGGRLPFRMSNASNAWAIAPQRSAGGSAMLAGDPHLEIRRLPQFWYAVGVHVENDALHALGITVPGMPVIIMGHNGKAAWAFTVGGVDVLEFYREKMHPADSSRYRTEKGWQRLEIKRQSIPVRGRNKPYELTIRRSRHGPLMFVNDSLKHSYSMHWAGYDTDLNVALNAGFHLMVVETFGDFRRTVTRLGALDAGWMYADRNGNIGYQLGTPIPIRPDSVREYPLPGWKQENVWRGFYELDETPHAFNPERGWLATCNNQPQRTVGGAPLPGHFAYDRILRIRQLLQSKNRFSAADMERFQMDRNDVYLLRWKQRLIALFNEFGLKREAAVIQAWDGDTSPDSRATALVNRFLHAFKTHTFEDELGDAVQKMDVRVLAHVLEQPQSDWYDDVNSASPVETRRDILRRTMDSLRELGDKTVWGDIHHLTMKHPLAVVPGLDWFLPLTIGPVPYGGTPGSLNASFYFEDESSAGRFESVVGPSWRFIIDFADTDAATMVLPAGNSGNPVSPHFDDFYPYWRSGKRWNTPLSRTRVFERARQMLTFKPKQP